MAKQKTERTLLVKGQVIATPKGTNKHVCILVDEETAALAPISFKKQGGNRKKLSKTVLFAPDVEWLAPEFVLIGELDKQGNLKRYAK